MHSPTLQKPEDPTPEPQPKAEAPRPETVPVVPAPPLGDSDYEWDPAVDPMEGLDPATTWWGG
jgi:hypothetical protein